MIFIHWLYSSVGNNVVMVKSVVKWGFVLSGEGVLDVVVWYDCLVVEWWRFCGGLLV
jgi:hypothetical protein